MAKYSFEFKLKIVQEYLKGKRGYIYLSEKYNMPSFTPIRRWVNAYNAFGQEGLKRKQQRDNYSFEFKKNVVELYLSTEMSYLELAINAGMNNPTLISRWVNDYRIVGLDGLKPKKRGRRMNMSKSKKINKKIDSTSNDVNSEYLKQLEEENLKLRIENAYLKEVRRLRLEEEKTLRQRRES